MKRGTGLPEICDDEAYLIAAFAECGVTKPGAMGDVPLDWADVLAFAQGTLSIALGDDVATLYHMCRGYWGAHQAAQDAMSVAPVERG